MSHAKNKLTRQDVFNRVWRHYIVEGQPFAAANIGSLPYPEPQINTKDGHKSPMALVSKANLNQHVDVAFLTGLQSAHVKAVNFVFDNVRIELIRNLYARAHRRVFRKTMKYFLIAFAMNYDLTIPSETAINAVDIRLAAKNKR